jgi:hypothetical protein
MKPQNDKSARLESNQRVASYPFNRLSGEGDTGGKYYNLFIIRRTTRLQKTYAIPKNPTAAVRIIGTNTHHCGRSTHHHDQFMWCVNFKPMNKMVNKSNGVILNTIRDFIHIRIKVGGLGVLSHCGSDENIVAINRKGNSGFLCLTVPPKSRW